MKLVSPRSLSETEQLCTEGAYIKRKILEEAFPKQKQVTLTERNIKKALNVLNKSLYPLQYLFATYGGARWMLFPSDKMNGSQSRVVDSMRNKWRDILLCYYNKDVVAEKLTKALGKHTIIIKLR